MPLSEVIVGPIQPVLFTLLGGSALLLLIAAVNVANLLLVRSEGRRREIAVRSGLGASPFRLAAQFVTEGLLLVAASAVLGLGAAHWTAILLKRLIPRSMLDGLPFLAGLGLHARELEFAGIVSLLAAILFTVMPAVRLSLTGSRIESGRGYSGAAWRRLGAHMVILELATASVLLIGAGLLGKSLYRVLQVDLGLRPDGVAVLGVGGIGPSYSKNEQMTALNSELLRRISNIPGVQSVASSSMFPISGGNTVWLRFLDRADTGAHNEVQQRQVTEKYFSTLGARILKGRYFTETDDAARPLVVIVDKLFVDKYYPGKDPLGQQFSFQSIQTGPFTVVGVVDTIKEGALDKVSWPTMYTPFNQNPSSFFNLIARTSQDEHALIPAMTVAIHEYDRSLMAGQSTTLSDQINDSPAAYLRRSAASLAAGFAGLALILGVVGLYGVITYSVSQRTREIGVRIALGAQTGTVYRMIMKEAAWLVGIGLAVGLIASIGAAALIRGLLFGTKSWDLETLAENPARRFDPCRSLPAHDPRKNRRCPERASDGRRHHYRRGSIDRRNRRDAAGVCGGGRHDPCRDQRVVASRRRHLGRRDAGKGTRRSPGGSVDRQVERQATGPAIRRQPTSGELSAKTGDSLSSRASTSWPANKVTPSWHR